MLTISDSKMTIIRKRKRGRAEAETEPVADGRCQPQREASEQPDCTKLPAVPRVSLNQAHKQCVEAPAELSGNLPHAAASRCQVTSLATILANLRVIGWRPSPAAISRIFDRPSWLTGPGDRNYNPAAGQFCKRAGISGHNEPACDPCQIRPPGEARG